VDPVVLSGYLAEELLLVDLPQTLPQDSATVPESPRTGSDCGAEWVALVDPHRQWPQ